MSFTDQKPRVATEQEVNARWGGKNFRCYLCGHKFSIGDVWRWVYAADRKLFNVTVCEKCDGPDVLERWEKHYNDAKQRFWWLFD